jgi:multidrug transporter EmrE-like cation transporter
MRVAFLVPLLTVIVGQVAYQLAQKAVPVAANPFATLSFAYLVGLVTCLALASMANIPVRLSDVRAALSSQTWILGASVVAIEFGYLQAYRNGWGVGVIFAIAATVTTILLATIGALWLEEALSLRRLVGLGLSTCGVWLLISRK